MRNRTLCCLLLLAGTSLAPAGPVPELKLSTLDGHPQKLSALRGNIVVLSFWATWCAPCQQELPRLSKLSQSYSAKPVRFLAVSIDKPKDRAKIAPLLEKQAIQLEIWTGASTDTMARFGLGDIVPSTLILDEQGDPITRIEGEAQDEDVSSRIDWLLAGRPGPAPEARLKRY
jgi:thiol-disulfide isomerase/thioredoxin